ncbi:hypothetical protein P0R31_14330 [Bradyrhizobium yuanmingense]|uniref:hypothetical protein n=1 Tax=Bradyrhizobium yuanmingense TaxID=108015 RepID=UPI0023B9EBD0|nr:hypothetical protein [Bradyrhizobium yuanmingense]MDF0518411.1 hypothetical protein [Bradyrhizobium yuanmingense]
MCDKCAELDEKIEHYRAILSRVTDQIALNGISELIAELLAEKTGLHPEHSEEE